MGSRLAVEEGTMLSDLATDLRDAGRTLHKNASPLQLAREPSGPARRDLHASFLSWIILYSDEPCQG